jgi:hypothetical protein
MGKKLAQASDHYSVFRRSRFGATRVSALALVFAAVALAPSRAEAAAAKPAPVKAPAFDARRPADIIALLAAMDANAEILRKDQGQIFMKVTTPGGGFGTQMVGCDEVTGTCRAIALFSAFSSRSVNMAQINDYNRSQLTCRGIMTPSGEPSVMYAALLNARMTREEMREHVGVWQGCLTGFGEFIRDPVAFLSRPQG